MARVTADVGLSGCSVTHDGNLTRYSRRDASRAFERVFRRVDEPPTQPSETDGRAKKRRRVPSGYTDAEQSFDASQSAVLATVTLNLVPAPESAHPSLPDDARASVPLQLTSFVPKNETSIEISAFDPASATDITFSAIASPEVLEPLATHLDTAASVGAEWEKSSPSSRNYYIPFCRCTLLAPDAAQHVPPRLEIELRWPFGVSILGTWRARLQHRANMKILSTYMPDTASGDKTPWAPADFYDAVHVPQKNDISPRIQRSLPAAELFPYQQRSVDWMLRREGVEFSAEGELSPVEKETTNVPVSFSVTQDNAGRQCYVSHARGMLVSDLGREYDSTNLRGGILAEEMGLGKSVELISLMCLHGREISKADVYDPYLAKMVKASAATLIITPPAILEQWISEMNKHAPQLKCFHYRGLTKLTKHEATAEHLLQFDVVVTSYDVLSREVHHVTPPPDRSLRHKKEYEHRTSPLVDISWWRVCLDEAQMVESGVSQAAMVARMIPRCNAWAVSGTPLRNNVTDLIGLLIFLRCEPFASTKGLFARLDKASFRHIVNRLALRHTKDQIRDDLDIPPQKRVVITVPFTAIEDEYYNDMFRQMCDACFLSPEGAPLREDRGIDHPETIERMRDWLVRLRQTCLHSHVGEKNRKALGPKKQPLRTVQEVLQVMLDQNDTKLKWAAKELILAQMKHGHIYSVIHELDDNPKAKAIERYRIALQTTQEYVTVCREDIQAELAIIRSSESNNPTQYDSVDDEEDNDDTSAKFARMTTLRRSLRSFLELEHACYFFIGNMYFQWKENPDLTVPNSADYHEREKREKEWYDKAQSIRQEILKDAAKRTQRQMQKIADLRDRHQDLDLPEIEELGGIESSNVLEKLDTITQVINSQNAKMKEWRLKIIEHLTMSLVDSKEEKETTGDEFDTSLKVQDELYVYIQAFRTMVADITTAVHGTEDTLVNHELEQAVKQARGEDILKRGHAPELLLRLAQERAKIRPKPQHGSLKGVVASARQAVTSLQYRAETADKRAAAELVIAQKYLAQVQEMFSTKAELTTALEKELEQFRLTMNLRLEFYRQIQHISETVEDYEDEQKAFAQPHQLQRQLLVMNNQVQSMQANIQRYRVKQTYLNNLREGATKAEEPCHICLDDYERGILTTCGHKFCRDCIFTWWKTNHTCPQCRTGLVRGDLKDITHNKITITAQEESHGSGATASPASSSSSPTSIYSSIHNSTMNEINTIKLEDSYGSKVDMMARHLLWIRNNDPGAKTIIYSQFADFLQVLRLALRRFRIGVSNIRDKNGIEKFEKDPTVECFLLDAKSNSSGLNLVNATYVFLCEPLINPALELQAIARVHRIGQRRATTVFMYIVGNTVEEAIYDISVKRRLEHIGHNAGSRSGTATPAASEQAQERKLDVANSEEIKAAALSKLVQAGNQGEVVLADDLWKCLFGKPRIPSNDEPAAVEGPPRLRRRQNDMAARREQFMREIEAGLGDLPPAQAERYRLEIAAERQLEAIGAAAMAAGRELQNLQGPDRMAMLGRLEEMQRILEGMHPMVVVGGARPADAGRGRNGGDGDAGPPF